MEGRTLASWKRSLVLRRARHAVVCYWRLEDAKKNQAGLGNRVTPKVWPRQNRPGRLPFLHYFVRGFGGNTSVSVFFQMAGSTREETSDQPTSFEG